MFPVILDFPRYRNVQFVANDAKSSAFIAWQKARGLI